MSKPWLAFDGSLNIELLRKLALLGTGFTLHEIRDAVEQLYDVDPGLVLGSILAPGTNHFQLQPIGSLEYLTTLREKYDLEEVIPLRREGHPPETISVGEAISRYGENTLALPSLLISQQKNLGFTDPRSPRGLVLIPGISPAYKQAHEVYRSGKGVLMVTTPEAYVSDEIEI